MEENKEWLTWDEAETYLGLTTIELLSKCDSGFPVYNEVHNRVHSYSELKGKKNTTQQ